MNEDWVVSSWYQVAYLLYKIERLGHPLNVNLLRFEIERLGLPRNVNLLLFEIE